MRAFGILPASAVQRSTDRVGGLGIVGQTILQNYYVTSVTAPAEALWVFAEAIGRGGTCGGNNNYRSGGGAGGDAIAEVAPGETIQVSLPGFPNDGSSAPTSTTVTIRSQTIVTAASAPASNSSGGPGAAGKYPGGSGEPTGFGGKGGGRLGGLGSDGFAKSPGVGAGCSGNSVGASTYGGTPCICLTFFTTYDAALAFAKAVYGGTWNP